MFNFHIVESTLNCVHFLPNCGTMKLSACTIIQITAYILALILGSCVSRGQGSLVHTVFLYTVQNSLQHSIIQDKIQYERLGSSHQLASSSGHSQILSHSRGEKSVLHGCRIKSGSCLGTGLATNYAPDEEVMKILSHYQEKLN